MFKIILNILLMFKRISCTGYLQLLIQGCWNQICGRQFLCIVIFWKVHALGCTGNLCFAFIESLWILILHIYMTVMNFVDPCPRGRSVLAECTQGQTVLGEHYSPEQVGRLNTNHAVIVLQCRAMFTVIVIHVKCRHGR